jgi:hypothetical protein
MSDTMNMSVEALERRFEALRDEVRQYNARRQEVIKHPPARQLPEGVADLCAFKNARTR